MRSESRQALDLLQRSAAPDRRHLVIGLLWLIVAAALEALGPLIGKALIDQHLLPHHLDWPRMAAMLAGILIAGWIGSILRYLQLVRLSGLAIVRCGVCVKRCTAMSCACQ